MEHRIVSPIEMYSVSRHRLELYKSICFYIRVENSSSNSCANSWQQRIEDSLRSTIKAQPRLQLQVDQSRKEPRFIVLPVSSFENLPIRRVERNDETVDEFLMKHLQIEVNTGFSFNESSPLWRLIILADKKSPNFDMIVSLSHAIADGISGMAFFTTFIDYLSSGDSVQFSLADDNPLDERIPNRWPPFSSLLKDILEKILLPKPLAQYFFPKTYWTGVSKPTDQEENKTNLKSLTLSASVVKSLLERARQERTTINSVLLAAILLSIVKTWPNDEIEFLSNIAVNLRPYCQPKVSNAQMGVFVSAADTVNRIRSSDIDQSLLWSLSRQIKEQVNRKIQNSVIPLITSLKFITDWDNFLLKQRQILPNGLSSSVDISNLLSWSFDSRSADWQITRGGFTQSSNLVGSCLTASVVTVNGHLHLILSFQEHRFNKNPVEIEQMVACLNNYLIEHSLPTND